MLLLFFLFFVPFSFTFSSPFSSDTIPASLVSSLHTYALVSSTAYCSPTASPNPTLIPLYVPTGSSPTSKNASMGYIRLDTKHRSIVIAFSGTKTWKQLILHDTNVRKVPVRGFEDVIGFPKEAKMHKGFAWNWEKLGPQIFSGVIRLLDLVSRASASPASSALSEWKITATGHSLGGVMATLAALHLATHLPRTLFPDVAHHIQAITYGTPRFANPVFAKWINTDSRVSILRVTNPRDPIIRSIPRKFGYIHAGKEIMVTSRVSGQWCLRNFDRGGEDPRCASKKRISLLVGLWHGKYFGIGLGVKPCETKKMKETWEEMMESGMMDKDEE